MIGGGLTGDRHGDRAARVLRGAVREDARALRAARAPSAAPRRGAARVRRRGARDRSTSSSRTAARSAPSARRPRPRAARPNFQPLIDAWGGVTLAYRTHADRLAGVPPQPRGGREVPRGGRALHRARVAEGGARRRARRACARWSSSAGDEGRQARRHGRDGRARLRARCASPPAPRPNVTYETRDARARSRWTRRPRRSARTAPRRRRRQRLARARRTRGLLHVVQRRRTRRQLLRRQPPASTRAASSRRWRARRTATRTSRRSSRTTIAALLREDQPTRDAAWTALRLAKLDDELDRDGRTRSKRLTPTIVEVIVRAPRAAREVPARAVLPPAELRGRRARWSTARASRWRASRSPARGSTRRRACSRLIVLEMGGSHAPVRDARSRASASS